MCVWWCLLVFFMFVFCFGFGVFFCYNCWSNVVSVIFHVDISDTSVPNNAYKFLIDLFCVYGFFLGQDLESET